MGIIAIAANEKLATNDTANWTDANKLHRVWAYVYRTWTKCSIRNRRSLTDNATR